jgi:ABC-2 type transport system permease protein
MKVPVFKTIKKYLRVFSVFLSNSISYEAQYRADTIIKLFVNLFWIGMLFTVITVIFSQTSTIAGWSKQEVYLMTVLWIIADEMYVMFFGSNLQNIPTMVVDGELDNYLTKPVSSLFLVSFKFFLMRSVYRVLIQFVILFWLVWKFDFAVSYLHSILVVLLIIVAVVIDYSRSLIGNTLGFWFMQIENLNEVLGSLSVLGRYPLEIWPKTVKILFLTFLPVAFSGFIPTATLTGRWPWYGILYAFIFAIVLLFIAIHFWRFAIRSYSSASS